MTVSSFPLRAVRHLLVVLLVALLAGPAIAGPPGHKGKGVGKGPPPHAPAHGYRHKLDRHPDVEVVFDATLGVYAVSRHRDVFFWRDHFYRLIEGHWQMSAKLEADWLPVPKIDLPHRLRMHAGGFSHGHVAPAPPAKRKKR